jgi:hypothetical protein
LIGAAGCALGATGCGCELRFVKSIPFFLLHLLYFLCLLP